MYIILSPSKSQDFSKDFSEKISEENFFVSEFDEETKKLSKIMKKKSQKDLEKIMKISPKLAELNFNRFQKWNGNFSERKKERGTISLGNNPEKKYYNFSPAIFSFTGDVYRGIKCENWNKKDFLFAEKSLGIISGFYGILSPLSFLKPYRLEMGTKLFFKIGKNEYKNLYNFWEEKLTNKINFILKKEKILINLASLEYSKVLNRGEILKSGAEILDIEFKISKNGVEKIIAIFAKRARGDMANWIIENKVIKKNDIKKFSVDGWKFSKKNSSENKFSFVNKK